MTPVQSMSRRQKSDSKKAASRGLQWTSDMIRKIVDDKTYIGCMVYGKTKIPDPGTGKEDIGCFAGKADNKMLEHIVLAEIKSYLRQNISQEQMQQSMRK